jgi:hypothetical protein
MQMGHQLNQKAFFQNGEMTTMLLQRKMQDHPVLG